MPGRSFRGIAPPLTDEQLALRDALQRDIETLAVKIGERNFIKAGEYIASAQFIEDALRDAGCATSRVVMNIAGEVRGARRPQEIVVIGAHYDSVVGSPGADDNGSGVAAMLALARAFAHARPARTIRFVAFANEEPPFFMTDEMGSWIYAKHCSERKETIVAMLSLESIAYFTDAPQSQQLPAMLGAFYPSTGNFITFVSNLKSRSLLKRCVRAFRKQATVASEGGAMPEAVPGVAWSDQWAFWRFGYDAIMVTDTAPFRNPHYHMASDMPQTLDYERTARVVEGLMTVTNMLVAA